MTQDEAVVLLEIIAEVYPKFDITEKKLAILIPMLEKMDYDRVRNKLSTYIVTYPFPPTIADIAAYAPEENKQLAMMQQWQKDAALVPEETRHHFTEQFNQLLKG